MSANFELKFPYVENSYKHYRNLITQGASTKLDPVREWEIKQAFFAGFASAMTVHASLAETSPRIVADVEQDIREELKFFSGNARELAASLGLKAQRLGKIPSKEPTQ